MFHKLLRGEEEPVPGSVVVGCLEGECLGQKKGSVAGVPSGSRTAYA